MGRIAWKGHRGRKGSSKLALHIGEQLRKLRETNQWSQRQTEAYSGLSNSFISQIENGQVMPSAESLWGLSKAFGVAVSYWFDGYEGENDADNQQEAVR
jgi:transcriptional regulator with XRE-family HTH domain